VAFQYVAQIAVDIQVTLGVRPG